MPDGVAALAIGAGMLAALNPCGFAMLPAYLTLLVAGDEPGRAVAVSRALTATAAMTAGFTGVFAVFGLLVAPVAASAQQYLPWFSLVVGLLILGAGLWVLSGRSLAGPRARPGGAPVTRSLPSMVGYGATYALASLTCTIAPFLAVVVAAFRTESVVTGGVLFLLYAAGMGLVVGTAAVAVALANQSVVATARRMSRFVPTAAGLLLSVVGAYVAWYGWWEVRVLRGGATADPVVDAAASVQRTLAGAVADLGPGGVALVALALLAVAVVAGAVSRRVRRRRPDPAEPADART